MQAKTLLTESKILTIAKDTLELESKSISNLTNKLNKTFVEIVHSILESKGRVVVTGIGKSAIIGQKIVATFNSTGTPSLFMHAADAIHGDLGMVQKDDIVICISKSGNSPEIKALIPLLKQGANLLIGMTGDLNSALASQSDFILDTTVEAEACPNNLAPTTSTSAQLAMGDALAVVLLSCRNFTSEDFAKYHPGGALGKKIYLRLEDMLNFSMKPSLAPDSDLRSCILEISEGRVGAAVVCKNENVLGIITDGDLRRMLYSNKDFNNLVAKDIMTVHPKTMDSLQLAVEGVQMLKEHKINHIIATKNDKYLGIIHIQDFIREGLI